MQDIDPADGSAIRSSTDLPVWLREGARALFFRAPRWESLHGGPWSIAALTALALCVGVVAQWDAVTGPVEFNWRGLLDGWGGTLITIWICWFVVAVGKPRVPGPRGAGSLMTLQVAMILVFTVLDGLIGKIADQVYGGSASWPGNVMLALWIAPLVWLGAAQVRLWWRVAGSPVARTIATALTPLPLVISGWLQPMAFWSPDRAVQAEQADAAPYGLSVDEDVLDTQTQLLEKALRALPPSQPGRVNVYAATYAPYMSEDVFMHESEVVAKTMAERFDAGDRTVQLVANRKTQTTLPWATRPNLRRTIERMAAVMNREQDVLFLHLTSHGGKDGRLATDTFPLESEPLTPALLKQWLDGAGVRWRVISVSACYSGSWIAPLADDGTLVMTAADADHTSYGCGSRSPLTFFGQAMYVDALRDTWSFTQAHAQARKLIDAREREAGKSDGYSNPQISEGAAIAPVLRRLEAQQADR